MAKDNKLVYPNKKMYDTKGEHEAWLKLARLINKTHPQAGSHKSGCKCKDEGCQLYNAIRAWGKVLVGDEEAERLGL